MSTLKKKKTGTYTSLSQQLRISLLRKTEDSPGGASGKELTCQYRRCKRCGFNPWVRKIPWRRAWEPTPIFLPGESHGKRNPADYSPWRSKGLDMTEAT